MTQQENEDMHPVVRTLAEAQPAPIVDEPGGGVTYYGYAPLGTRTDEAKWKIVRVTVSGSVTLTEYAERMQYKSVWDNRASLTYRR